uniref:G-protein coupled receptors family 3 profile domain-containing protein n=1 Tax=Pseudonaja textilis TaxID=8673 RepID=A0A670YRI4_PSETE
MCKNYQQFLSLVFAVTEVNKDLVLLPNITLGFHIYDNHQIERTISITSLSLLSTQGQMVPGYKCDKEDPLLSVIGEFILLLKEESYFMQLGVGFEFSQGERRVYPSFFRINPKESPQYVGLVQLLLYFRWNWVGLVAPEDDRGEHFISTLTPMLQEKEICLAFTEMFDFNINAIRIVKFHSILKSWLNVEVIILFGDASSSIKIIAVKTALEKLRKTLFQTVWIMSSHWELNGVEPQVILDRIKPFHGALHFRDQTGDVGKQCTGKENLQNLPTYMFEMSMTGESYNIYNAIYAVAYALHAMHNLQLWQVKAMKFPFAGDEVSFLENGRGSAGYDILNWIFLPNCSFIPVKVGEIDPGGLDFTINSDTIVWATKVMPFARCGRKRCHAGERRSVPEGEPVCCYKCDTCPGGTISNQTVLVIFRKHHNTPIVKANNRDLTYILLVSLLLCFLCSFLFIGRPGKLTCLFRQIAFAILFALAVSSVLAKTVMVVLAFMATKPGNRTRKLLGKPLTNSIVLGCPLVQAVLCATWLATSPPFPNLDFHSLFGETILECKEGSISMFYAVLTYLGFLALVSFTVAFLARKLPDSFNEAKFITFSMLVFCSVWITFLPTYLSTKGKSMVAVEIFSILASGAGLLTCIFFPKCYIILVRPNLNCRENIMKHKNP